VYLQLTLNNRRVFIFLCHGGTIRYFT